MNTHFDDISTFRIQISAVETYKKPCHQHTVATWRSHQAVEITLFLLFTRPIGSWPHLYALGAGGRRSAVPREQPALWKGRPQGSSVVVVRLGDRQRPLLQISRWPRGGGFEPTTSPIALSSPAFRSLASAVTPAAETTTRLLAVLCNVLLLAPSTLARRGAEIVVKTLELMCGQKLAGSCQRHGTRNPHADQIGTSMWG